MKKFLLEMLTPKGPYLISEVEELYLNTSLGYMGIMANHDTLITGVETAPGFIKRDGKIDYYAIFEGVLHVSKNGVKLVVSNIENANDIDIERAKMAHERALERLAKKAHDLDLTRCEKALKRAQARLDAAKRRTT